MAERKRLICPAADLAECGKGVRFSLTPESAEEKGFAVRYLGDARGFVNRCPHLGTELDWNPGEFFDLAGLYLTCSTHGAIFDPKSGLCVAGPCRGASLEPLVMREQGGQVFLIDDEP
jgi:nitrite reductase/ring-hydroxylating ferredoxin subunit